MFQASGKISHPSLKSTSYNSPKPTVTIGKKVSPFVLKPLNKETPSPELMTIENATTKYSTKNKPQLLNSEDEDSLDIGPKTKKTSNELNISSSSEGDSPPSTLETVRKTQAVKIEEISSKSDNNSLSTRKSLRRKAVKPPIIDDEEEDSYVPNIEFLSANTIEQNTVDVLETSMEPKAISSILENTITIQNQKTKAAASKNCDVIIIGNNDAGNLLKKHSTTTELSGQSIQAMKNTETSGGVCDDDNDDELPLCGIEQEISNITNTPNQIPIEVTGKLSNKSSAVDINNESAGAKPKKTLLSRSKKNLPETPKLEINNYRCTEAVTPSQLDAIKSTNTVLETPVLQRKEVLSVLETPTAHVQNLSQANVSRKRCINFETSDGGRPYGSKEKKMKCTADDVKSTHSLSTHNTETKNKSCPKMKEFLDKCTVVGITKLPIAKSPSGLISRKNTVAEIVSIDPLAAKTSPKLTIDKVGHQINYTIEKESPAAKLTIIQEGQMLSPKLMKHIYDDVLHSDPDSCAELINSLIEDNENNLKESVDCDDSNTTKVDHNALIFGIGSKLEIDNKGLLLDAGPNSKKKETGMNDPDSLEGYTYQQTDFNEAEFKKTFGISSNSPLVLCDENELRNIKANIVQDSQPGCYQDNLSEIGKLNSKIQEPEDLSVGKVESVDVFDEVPDRDAIALACDSANEFSTPVILKQPRSSSTPHSKVAIYFDIEIFKLIHYRHSMAIRYNL